MPFQMTLSGLAQRRTPLSTRRSSSTASNGIEISSRKFAESKERDRLQKYADPHIQAAEVAVLTRDVVLEACRAMNVVPPPILELVTDASAEARGAA
jgi:hypothetical protein